MDALIKEPSQRIFPFMWTTVMCPRDKTATSDVRVLPNPLAMALVLALAMAKLCDVV